ncbi:MAG TPA: hypothetical protein DCG14_05135 [Phycisphaerales bacterium]|nr:hypothetical protein [Phycisphaerales bacterium]
MQQDGNNPRAEPRHPAIRLEIIRLVPASTRPSGLETVESDRNPGFSDLRDPVEPLDDRSITVPGPPSIHLLEAR